jgi:hypothetical protein
MYIHSVLIKKRQLARNAENCDHSIDPWNAIKLN